VSPLYGICIGIALVVSWQAFQWLADRLTFETKAGAIFGRAITSTIVGAALCFVLSGVFLEFVTSRTEVSSGLGVPAARELSSFAAAVFGGIFGAIWGCVWGLARGFSDARAITNTVLPSKNGAVLPSWLLPMLILGLAVYAIGLSYQTQLMNIFGQVCERAHSNAQRVGQACFRPEWLAIGVVLAVTSLLSWKSGSHMRRPSVTKKGQD
jgi:hypothetical protein